MCVVCCISGNLKFIEDGDKSQLHPECIEAATIAAELIGSPLEEMITALTSKKIYVANTAMQTYLDVAKVSSDASCCISCASFVAPASQSLAWDLA